MWALALQLLSIAAGWQVMRLLPLRLRRLEALAASIAVGFNLASWVFFGLAMVFGFRVGVPLGAGLLVAWCVVAQWRLPRRVELTSEAYSRRWRWVAQLVAIAITLWLAYLMVLSYQFPGAGGAWYSNGNVWGDSPLHVGLTTQFSHGNRVDLISPVYERVPLAYPFMPDFYSGVLMRLTSSWRLGLMLPSLVMLLALVQLVFSLGLRLTRSVRAAWLQWLTLVFSGSLHGGWVLSQVLLTKGLSGYTQAVGTSLAFATGDNYLNFFNSHPFPQRSYLFGMPLLIVVAMVALELYHDWGHRRLSTRTARFTGAVAGFLAGLLPLVHTHSFLVVAAVLALAAGAIWWRRRALPPGWWSMFGVMAAMAAPQLLWQFVTTYSGGFSRWIFGWMMRDFVPLQHANWLWFWFLELGFIFVVMLAGWYWLRRAKAAPELWLIYVAGLSIFAVCNVYVFQPTIWDNMKFFEYAFWMEMIVSAYLLARWSRRRWGALVVAGLMASLCAMGFYTLVLSGPPLTFQLLSAADVKFGEDMQYKLPADAYLLVSDRHNHPITMLADRKVLMTYSGWYNLYHANWPTVLADRDSMLQGAAGAPELIRQYGLTDAVFSDDEVADGEANLDFYQQHYALFVHEDGWWVFDLRRPL